MRKDPTPVTFRDAVAVLAMLAVATAIIIGLIYLLAPPVERLPPPKRITQQSSGSAITYCAAPGASAHTGRSRFDRSSPYCSGFLSPA